jgi:pyruvate/2-oxoglutarate dehydrogenase complex dihydrolipoamide acyltransferase (E2) component
MPSAVRIPRVNNNDDSVKVVRLLVTPGNQVAAGDVVAEIETEKSVALVEAEQSGYVLAIACSPNDQVAVGSVMMWLGAAADEAVPDAPADPDVPGVTSFNEPTAKARALLQQHGLSVRDVPVSGRRLSVSDVEAYVALRHANRVQPSASDGTPPTGLAAGTARPFTVEERGMLRTITWHKEQATPAYVEVEYDPKPWQEYSAAYTAEHRLMLDPMLSLLAYRLVKLATDAPKINATVTGDRLYLYEHVNLGFTVQANEILYLVVVRDADLMNEADFISALGKLQRHAVGGKLRVQESQGATVALSSMARWDVSRHIPILSPYTSIMVAHTGPRQNGWAALGATYDHRVLTGFEVSQMLKKLSTPHPDAQAPTLGPK